MFISQGSPVTGFKTNTEKSVFHTDSCDDVILCLQEKLFYFKNVYQHSWFMILQWTALVCYKMLGEWRDTCGTEASFIWSFSKVWSCVADIINISVMTLFFRKPRQTKWKYMKYKYDKYVHKLSNECFKITHCHYNGASSKLEMLWLVANKISHL
jgi:hypothetical protein